MKGFGLYLIILVFLLAGVSYVISQTQQTEPVTYFDVFTYFTEGKVDQYKVDDTVLTMHLREKDIFDLTTVKYAILETNGQLSTLLYGKDTPPTARDLGVRVPEARLPITLITGGKLLRDNLSLVGLSEQELSRRLESQGCTLKSTLLYTLDTAGHGYLIKREDMV